MLSTLVVLFNTMLSTLVVLFNTMLSTLVVSFNLIFSKVLATTATFLCFCSYFDVGLFVVGNVATDACINAPLHTKYLLVCAYKVHYYYYWSLLYSAILLYTSHPNPPLPYSHWTHAQLVFFLSLWVAGSYRNFVFSVSSVCFVRFSSSLCYCTVLFSL